MKILMSLIMITVLCTPIMAWDHVECRRKMDRAAENFMNEVFKVSRLEQNLSPQERQIRYVVAAEKVMSIAADLGIDTDRLTELLEEHIENAENTRRPPPGWDPDDRRANLLMFHKMSKISLGLDLELMSYGRRICNMKHNETLKTIRKDSDK